MFKVLLVLTSLAGRLAAAKEVTVAIPTFQGGQKAELISVSAFVGDTLQISFGNSDRTLEAITGDGSCDNERTELSSVSPYVVAELEEGVYYYTLDNHGFLDFYKPCNDGYKAQVTVTAAPTAAPTQSPTPSPTIKDLTGQEAGNSDSQGSQGAFGSDELLGVAVASGVSGALMVGLAFRKYQNGRHTKRNRSAPTAVALKGSSNGLTAFKSSSPPPPPGMYKSASPGQSSGRVSEVVTRGAAALRVLDKGRNPSRYSAMMIAKVFKRTGKLTKPDVEPEPQDEYALNPVIENEFDEDFERQMLEFITRVAPEHESPKELSDKLLNRYTRRNISRALKKLYGEVPSFLVKHDL